MLQERAEIQNMVVVRHWSLVDLHRLYGLAEDEDTERRAQHRLEPPPPRFDAVRHTNPDPRLQIEGPRTDEDTSKAMVKYNETALDDLDKSLNRALSRPNKLLRAPGDDIVDRLLDEWTRVRGTPSQKKNHRSRKHRARYDTDSDDSEINFERGDIGGRHIGAPPRKPRNVHFERARVESGSEESDSQKPRHRGPRHSILDSDSVSTSTTESDSDLPPLRRPRRYSDGSSSRAKPAMAEFGNQTRRPYTSAGGGSPQSSRPNSRSGPAQPPQPLRPGGPIQNPSWPNQQPPNPPGSSGLRPPAPYNNIPPGPKRMSSSGPFTQPPPPPPGYTISPGTSPNTRGM
ncbi:MAG: hypothetical protein Q9223_006839, partial [Gallowayella weberi]